MHQTNIQDVQGTGLRSPLGDKTVRTRGVVTGATRKGFFVQDPRPGNAAASCGLFVFKYGSKPPRGAEVEVEGRVVDYLPNDDERPTTQLEASNVRVLNERGPDIEPVWLTAERVLTDPKALAQRLNALEGMVVGVEAGATFAAPSNPFGDYVLLPQGASLQRTEHGGVLIDPAMPERWLPSMRMLAYGDAPRVNVGAELHRAVSGPLNFRSSAYQIVATTPVLAQSTDVARQRTTLTGSANAVTVLTLNCFNLDPHVESAELVLDADRDIDDDLGSGRFDRLAEAIASDARCPDIVALQEIQDGDGAEITELVSAEKTLRHLVRAVERAGGPPYRYAEIPPEAGADGGQPGGNIRNAFLFRPDRVELVPGSLRRLAVDAQEYEGSRKPLSARFRPLGSKGGLEIINVHLASKRHQLGLFAPERPGYDSRLDLRVAQVERIGEHLHNLRAEGIDYYVTGDFNDFEFSATLQVLSGDHSRNLIYRVPVERRFDYNHRGLSQALMHGVVAKRQLEGRSAEYEILHRNALTGVQPGSLGEKPSDHAYVLARLQLT